MIGHQHGLINKQVNNKVKIYIDLDIDEIDLDINLEIDLDNHWLRNWLRH